MTPLLRILTLWRPQAGSLGVGLVVAIAALGAGIGLMVLAGRYVALAAGAVAVTLPFWVRTIGAARIAFRYAERLTTHSATFRALAALRVWFFRGVATRSAGGLGLGRTGDVLARLVGDIDALDGLFLRVLVPLAGAIVLLPVLVAAIGVRSPPLATGVGLLFACAAFLFPWIGAQMAASAGTRLADAASGLRIVALDALTGLREVRAFGAEGRMLAIMQAREGALLAAQHGLASRSALAGAAAFLCGQAALGLVLVAALVDPTAGITMLFLVIAAFEAVTGLPRAGVGAGHAAAAARRVLAAAEDMPAASDPPCPAPPPSGSALRFEAVSFRWQADRPAVFDGLMLDVPEGARVAILGPSGSGKSTLAALALKVVAPQAGAVRLGGVDIADLAAADVRSRMGWLSQATHLFNDTIRANLLLARPDADDAALWAALDAARIGELVRGLPDRLDAWVGEGGARFSGGQGRRLALARTLLAPARILILDEPCAGLDAATEQAFLSTLNDVAAGRGVILITHRLTGVERLDRIWRLTNGRAVAAAG